MVERARNLNSERVAANLAAVRERIAAAARRAGRDPGAVEVVAATKYVALEDLPVLAEAGLRTLGENRAQDLEAKHAAHGDAFRWDFIGQLQSRKVRQVAPLVYRIHSLASDSALRQLERHTDTIPPSLEVLVEVNVAGEEGKEGVAPDALGAFVARCPVPVAGLMTMPPVAADPADSRPHFAALRELAAAHGLSALSMGTTQDFEVAVEEGATIVRLGSVLYAG